MMRQICLEQPIYSAFALSLDNADMSDLGQDTQKHKKW
jgi:hypothetical protein